LSHASHFWNDGLDEITVELHAVKILLKLNIAEFISRFKFSIIVQSLLDGIICQMHITVRDIFQSELSAAGSQVSVAVPISLEISIYCAHQSEASDVELSIFVEQRFFNIFLYDIGSSVAVHVDVLNQTFDVVQFAADLDSASSVGVFTWFDDPQILAELGQFVQNGLF